MTAKKLFVSFILVLAASICIADLCYFELLWLYHHAPTFTVNLIMANNLAAPLSVLFAAVIGVSVESLIILHMRGTKP